MAKIFRDMKGYAKYDKSFICLPRQNPYFCLKCLKIKGLRDLESDLYTCCTPILKILLTGLPSIKKDS